MRRIDCNGIVVLLEANVCNVKEGVGDGSSIGTRRGGFVNDNEMVNLLSLLIFDCADW